MAKKKLYKNLTLQQKIAKYMLESNCKRVFSKTRKYMCFEANPSRFYFVGASGAVRVNDRNAAGDSQSITANFKKIIKLWEKKIDPKSWVELQPIFFED